MQGKLIILEGTDGSGKSTQLARLCRRLDEDQTQYMQLRFPQYTEPSSALIRMYLGGEFGDKPSDVNPYAASTFFAVDRFASYIKLWREFYHSGGLVLSDRYTTSNAVHQAAKLPESEREPFCRWLFDYEYRLMGIPAPDRVILLDMPVKNAAELIAARSRPGDIHEADASYLAQCRETALQVAGVFGWHVVRCAPEGRLRGVEEIHEEVLSLVAEEISGD